MSKSKIEWTDETWNPVTGCTKVSAGCRNCYAERMAKRLRGRHGYDADDPFRVTIWPDRLDEPLRWRKPRRVFVCSMGDLFHEDVSYEFQLRVFARFFLAPQHTFIVLTKRPDRMRSFFLNKMTRHQLAVKVREVTGKANIVGGVDQGCDPDACNHEYPLPNLWLGVSVENQAAADERIPLLLDTPAAVRFVSCEPLLGPVDLRYRGAGGLNIDHDGAPVRASWLGRGLDWVIVGSESGPRRREADIGWVRDIRDQCEAARVPLFLKQLHVGGEKVSLPELDGRTHEEWPGGGE